MSKGRPGASQSFVNGAFFALGLLSVGVSLSAVVGGYVLLSREIPDVEVLKTSYPWVQYRGKELPPLVMLRRERPPSWVSLPQVSRVAVGAVLVSEDWAFFQHEGYDAKQIKEAIIESWEEGRLSRGASTITQQVVRNVFLTKEKSLWRKLKELVLAIQLEKKVGKRRILEVYLNIAEWGEGFYGIANASRRYFKKAPARLSAKEGAFLAMLLPSPVRYGVSYRTGHLTPYAARTIRAILRKMAQAHYIPGDRVSVEWNTPLSFERVKIMAVPTQDHRLQAGDSDEESDSPDADDPEESQE